MNLLLLITATSKKPFWKTDIFPNNFWCIIMLCIKCTPCSTSYTPPAGAGTRGYGAIFIAWVFLQNIYRWENLCSVLSWEKLQLRKLHEWLTHNYFVKRNSDFWDEHIAWDFVFEVWCRYHQWAFCNQNFKRACSQNIEFSPHDIFHVNRPRIF